MPFFTQAARTPPAAAPSTWTFAALGDDTGDGITENSATSLTIASRGTNDPDNIQFAYQTVASGDIELKCRVPSSWTGIAESFTFFGLQIRESTNSGAVFVQCAWPGQGTTRAKYRGVTDGSITTGYGTGQDGQSLPQYLAITYDSSENEVKFWESNDDSDWYQVGETLSLTLSYSLLAGVFGTSHEEFTQVTATLTDCSVSGTITISAAPDPGTRTGILQDIVLASNTVSAYGGVTTTDAFRILTYPGPSGNNALVDESDGFTWDSGWDMTRVDINAEEGVSGPVDDNFVRYRLRYDQSYFDINGGGSGPNKPRNNLRWALGGNGGRYEDDREFWMAMTWYFPSDYEIDTGPDDCRETLLQFHNASGGSGHGRVTIGGAGSDIGRFNLITNNSDTTDEANGAGAVRRVEAYCDMADLIGEFVTVVINARFNPFSSNTTVDATMGRNPQIGESFLANQGKYRAWVSVPAGVTFQSDSLGPVTNSGAKQMMLVADRQNTPVGLVPSWRAGVSGQNPLDTSLYLYKPRWMDQIAFASRPTIPHDHSSKAGPITIYLGQVRFGDESSDYASVHPEQEAEPS